MFLVCVFVVCLLFVSVLLNEPTPVFCLPSRFTEHNYYTVLFGVSRAIGALSQLVVDRALGFPLERPKSFTINHLRRLAEAAKK